MKFFYSAGVMSYGEGYWWHRFFNFPKLPFVTKTLTLNPKKGNKYLILPVFNSVFNKVSLDNIGIYNFIKKYKVSDIPVQMLNLLIIRGYRDPMEKYI